MCEHEIPDNSRNTFSWPHKSQAKQAIGLMSGTLSAPTFENASSKDSHSSIPILILKTSYPTSPPSNACHQSQTPCRESSQSFLLDDIDSNEARSQQRLNPHLHQRVANGRPRFLMPPLSTRVSMAMTLRKEVARTRW